MDAAPRRVSPQSPQASLARDVSERVLERIRTAEMLGTRGRPGAGLEVLASTLVTLAPGADDDRVALAEMAALMTSWGADFAATTRVMDSALGGVRSPRARGAILLAQGRRSNDRSSTDLCSRALAEFTVADDVVGQAVTLGRMAFPVADGLDPDFRLDLGRRGLELALGSGVPWAVAMCAGQLAVSETYFDRPEARTRWDDVSRTLPVGADSLTAEISALNHANWALTALGWGDLELAEHALDRGRVFGRGAWPTIHAAVSSFLEYRRGNLAAADEAARAAMRGPATRRPLGAVVAAAVAYEQQSHLEATGLPDDVKLVMASDLQWGALGAAVLAMTRRARREPRPGRGLAAYLEQMAALRLRFGWEDAALALAITAPTTAEVALEPIDDLWSSSARGSALAALVAGIRKGPSGLTLVRDGAEALAETGETIGAGRAFYYAARLAQGEERHALRSRALDLLQQAGADRSLAEVLRDRTLGGSRRTAIPESQRHRVNPGLTPKEREVALLAADALTAAEIAAQLGISVGTVRNHLARVREKFGNVPKRRLTTLLADRRSEDRPSS